MIRFEEEKVAFHMTLNAYLDDTYVGRVDFDIDDYEPTKSGIDLIMVYVNDDQRRKGVATKMLKYLENKYGQVKWNGKTPDGESLYKSYYVDLKSI